MDTVSLLRDGAFWKIGADDLLSLGQELEALSRTVFAVNVHLAGEIDTQQLAKQRSCPSTAALLRQALLISPAEAHGRMTAARQILPQEVLTGGDLPPALPALATAVDTGTVGSEHVKTIVATMRKLPAALPIPDRDLWEKFLVGKAAPLDPRQLEVVAAAVLEAADPDGTLDEGDAKSITVSTSRAKPSTAWPRRNQTWTGCRIQGPPPPGGRMPWCRRWQDSWPPAPARPTVGNDRRSSSTCSGTTSRVKSAKRPASPGSR